MKSKILIVFLSCLAIQSCIKDDIGISKPDTFHYIWDEMDKNYGGFIPRNVNWDSIYDVYDPQIASNTSNEDLWDVCTSMLNTLDDQHIYLYDFNTQKGFSSGKKGDEHLSDKEFNISVVKENYINSYVVESVGEEEFIYGKINNENIGYIYIPSFDNTESKWHEKVDDAVTELLNTDGLIVDVRNNSGGDPLLDRFISTRFVVEEKLVFSIQTRNGVKHTDFDERTNYYATVGGGAQYTKPIVILANHSTVSAGEEFLLFLETQPHITIVGDTTSNAFSTQAFARLLPNGWQFGFPNQLYTYPNGNSPEGVGIVPDIYIRNDSLDVQNGIDKVLEKGIEIF